MLYHCYPEPFLLFTCGENNKIMGLSWFRAEKCFERKLFEERGEVKVCPVK